MPVGAWSIDMSATLSVNLEAGNTVITRTLTFPSDDAADRAAIAIWEFAQKQVDGGVRRRAKPEQPAAPAVEARS
jgi:hypothetical protein